MAKPASFKSLQSSAGYSSSASVWEEPRVPINTSALTELTCSSGSPDPKEDPECQHWGPTPPKGHYIQLDNLPKSHSFRFYLERDHKKFENSYVEYVGIIPGRTPDKRKLVVRCDNCGRYGKVHTKWYKAHKACPYCEKADPNAYASEERRQSWTERPWSDQCPNVIQAPSPEMVTRIGMLTLLGLTDDPVSAGNIAVHCDCGAYGVLFSWTIPKFGKKMCPYCKEFCIRFRQKAVICTLPEWWPINKSVIQELVQPDTLYPKPNPRKEPGGVP